MFLIKFDFFFLLGCLGQGCFALRFILQWYFSEKKKCSVIPVSFWYLSLAGSFFVFIYALYIQNIIFSTGSLLAMVIYMRNLVLFRNR